MRVYAVEAVLAEPPPFLPALEASPVVRTIAVREDQTLEQLHEALRLAFGWADAHLYSFWPSGEFWDNESDEYTAPFDLEERGENARSARILISELGLRKGTSLAYLFDFGDEWRLTLKIVDTWTDDGESAYPMLVGAEGVPPPQYAVDEDE